ncbi:MAG: TIGR01212 family radical SAM protein [Candidatus Cloacimonetes bacterium]|nr:TIGR01212 family radical SAM protein [Candidatus Cloacimonadota bacterium]
MRLEELIFTYAEAMKARYGRRVFRVGLSTGIECPHRAKGGCIFCNPDSFRGNYQTQDNSLEKQLYIGKAIIRKHCDAERFIAYFQDETSTAGEPEMLKALFKTAAADPEVVELVVSTRPDYVNEEILTILQGLVKPVRLELGLQSIHDRSLNYLNRGHSFADCEKAVKMCRRFSISVGVHLIMGIPGETLSDMIETVQWVSAQKEIVEIKFHNLVIYKGTRLAEMWNNGEVTQMPVEEYIELLSEIIPFIRKDIILSRLFTSNILHNDLAVDQVNGNKTKWLNALRLRLEKKNYYQGIMNPSPYHFVRTSDG